MRLINAPKSKSKVATFFNGVTIAVVLFIAFSGIPSKHAFQIGAAMGIGALAYTLLSLEYPKEFNSFGIFATCVAVCDCSAYPGNTAIGCNFLMAVEKYPWIMNMTDSTGAQNYIDLTVALDEAYFTAEFNETDRNARIYPYPEIKNIEDVRDKPVVYAWKDGTEVYVRQGVRKYQGMFPPDSASPKLTGIIENLRCNKDLGKFSVDANGTIWGHLSDDGTKLYPVKVDPQSVAAIFTKPTDTEPQMVGMQFNYHPSEADCQLAGIPLDSLTGGYDPRDAEGLFDVEMKVISDSHAASTLVVKLTDGWGDIAMNPEVVTGLLIGAFTQLYDNTASAPVVISAVAESVPSPGTYTLTLATAPVVGHHYTLTMSKNGYDFTLVAKVDIIGAA